MADSDHLSPAGQHHRALTGPERASPHSAGPGPGPLPSPADAAADDARFTLETALLGPLPLPAGTDHGPELEELARRAAVYATRARGEGTRRAYRSAWAQYAAWCATLAREPPRGWPSAR